MEAGLFVYLIIQEYQIFVATFPWYIRILGYCHQKIYYLISD